MCIRDRVNGAYKNVKGSMESIKSIKYDSVTNQWKELGRTFQTDVMTPALKKFLPAAQKGMTVLADNIETIVPVATAAGTAVGTIFVAKKAKTLIKDIKDVGSGIGSLIEKVLILSLIHIYYTDTNI